MTKAQSLKLLKQSVDQWNQWRQTQGRDRPIDLQGANLRRVNLIGADLSGVILRRADLREANLTEADLSHAILIDADCRGVNLSRANLSSSQLVQADLRRAILDEAILEAADCSRANFNKAMLSQARLNHANFSGADLSGTDLSYVCALATNFTATALTGACLEDWQIDTSTDLDQVVCDYIYLRRHRQERYPSQDVLTPGERSRLFHQAVGRLELRFKQGINWQAFVHSLKTISEQYGGTQLTVQGIESQGNGVVVVRVGVTPNAEKAEVHQAWMEAYDTALKALMQPSPSSPNPHLAQLAPQADISGLFDLLLTKAPPAPSDGVITVEVRKNGFSAPDSSLNDTATEIRRLLVRMAQAYPTTTEAKKQALVEKVIQQIRQKPLLSDHLMSHLEYGRVNTLLQQINHPLAHRLLQEFGSHAKTSS